jgi:stage III sporulation protein AH
LKFDFKKNKEKIKQITLSVMAFSLILVGYLNYSYNNKIIEVSAENNNEINLGDVELVSSDAVETEKQAIVSNDDLTEETNINLNNSVNTNGAGSEENNKIDNEEIKDDYFEETRIERDRMYSEMLEVYQKLIENNSTPEDQKSIAAQEVSNITNIKNGIMIAENLIKNKGFENVVILVNNGKVTVVVKSANLSQEQISKIQNIVQKQLDVEISNISISNK